MTPFSFSVHWWPEGVSINLPHGKSTSCCILRVGNAPTIWFHNKKHAGLNIFENDRISKYLGWYGQEEVWRYWVTNATECATNYHFVEQAQILSARSGTRCGDLVWKQKVWIKVIYSFGWLGRTIKRSQGLRSSLKMNSISFRSIGGRSIPLLWSEASPLVFTLLATEQVNAVLFVVYLTKIAHK